MLNDFSRYIDLAKQRGAIVDHYRQPCIMLENPITGHYFTSVCKPCPDNSAKSKTVITSTNLTGFSYEFHFSSFSHLLEINELVTSHGATLKRPIYNFSEALLGLKHALCIADDVLKKITSPDVIIEPINTLCKTHRKRAEKDPNAVVAVDSSWRAKVLADGLPKYAHENEKPIVKPQAHGLSESDNPYLPGLDLSQFRQPSGKTHQQPPRPLSR